MTLSTDELKAALAPVRAALNETRPVHEPQGTRPLSTGSDSVLADWRTRMAELEAENAELRELLKSKQEELNTAVTLYEREKQANKFTIRDLERWTSS